MEASPLLQQFIEALQCLPGVGPKSAQRMAFHLLKQGRDQARQLAGLLESAVEEIGHCERCRTFSEQALCRFCLDPRRKPQVLCIVESPSDQVVIEQSGSFRGLYFVLLGHLSPLDGIGPEAIGLDKLQQRLRSEPIEEVIIATNTTVEGETTAHVIAELVKQRGIRATRIASGVPIGGELEYTDLGTLARALADRSEVV